MLSVIVIRILSLILMMIVDANRSVKSMEELVSDLKSLGEEIGVVIRCQHEDIFNKMHRI